MTRLTSLGAAIFLLSLAGLPAQTEFFPVEDVQPGMIGVGRTVFDGETIEDFDVHILGVIRNVLAPQRDLILARLEGGPLARTGVIAGMSGSPVYLEGKLVGAVSYSLGDFSRDAIAGITPIQEMIDATAVGGTRVGRRPVPRLALPVTQEGLADTMRAVLAGAEPFASRADAIRGVGGTLLDATTRQLGTTLRPIATPLTIGGASQEVAGFLDGMFTGTGVMAVLGNGVSTGGGSAGESAEGTTGAKGTEAGQAPSLAPGDAVGIDLMNGDLTLGATGTVTYVDGTRVYALGHSFYNLGPTQFPMTRAHVLTLIPSLAASTKVASSGPMIGTIHQDRATGVAGELGAPPAMIPLRLSLESDRGLVRTFTFRMAKDQFFTPLLTYLAVYNTLGSYERENGVASYVVTGTASVDGHDSVTFDDLFSGDRPSMNVANYVAAPVSVLLANPDQPVEVTGLDLTIRSSEQPLTARLERVWLDAPRPRAGTTIAVKILTRTYGGEDVVHRVPVVIPPYASGRLTVLVTDATQLAQLERQERQVAGVARDLPQIVREFNRARRNNRLYVRLVAADAGAVVSGEPLPSLPPSVLAVLEGDRAGGTFAPLQSATLGEWEIPVEQAVTGSRVLTVDLETN